MVSGGGGSSSGGGGGGGGRVGYWVRNVVLNKNHAKIPNQLLQRNLCEVEATNPMGARENFCNLGLWGER